MQSIPTGAAHGALGRAIVDYPPCTTVGSAERGSFSVARGGGRRRKSPRCPPRGRLSADRDQTLTAGLSCMAGGRRSVEDGGMCGGRRDAGPATERSPGGGRSARRRWASPAAASRDAWRGTRAGQSTAPPVQQEGEGGGGLSPLGVGCPDRRETRVPPAAAVNRRWCHRRRGVEAHRPVSWSPGGGGWVPRLAVSSRPPFSRGIWALRSVTTTWRSPAGGNRHRAAEGDPRRG